MPDGNTDNALVPARGRRPTMIKGLVPSLPERGKIKIGIKGKKMTSQRGNEFQPPQKLDHFVVTTLERGQDGNFVPDGALMDRFGAAPKEIPVRLLYDDPSLNFPTRYACFIGRTLWCAGDGEAATRLTDTPKQTADGQKPEPREVQCPCFRQDPAYQGRDKCKMNGSLSVLIDGAGGLGGVWKFRTTSYNSIVGIMSSMAFIRSITGGVLANIPFVLRVQPKQATSPTDGSQLVIYVVTLEFGGDVSELQIISHQIALDRAKTHVSIEHIEDEARRYLALAPPANAPLPGDDSDDVVEEFYPEQAAEAWPTNSGGRQPIEPEPEPQRQLAEPDPGPSYLVIDVDGEEHLYATPATVESALQIIFREAKRRGREALDAAAENNRATIALLQNEIAERLAALWRELATDADPFGLPPLPSENSPPAQPVHERNTGGLGGPAPGGEPDQSPSRPAAALEPAVGHPGADATLPAESRLPVEDVSRRGDLLDDPTAENLTVPLPPRPTADQLGHFARQMMHMIGEGERTPQQMALIKLQNAHGIALLKTQAVEQYDEVMAALAAKPARVA